ncbi:MAG: hypothetical protein ACOCZS_03030 [Verrucomicrobiota bacterium]
MRLSFLLPFLTIPLLISGCIHFKQEIRIKADGSMEVEYLYSLPEEYISAFATGKEVIEEKQGERDSADYLAWPLNEELAREMFNSDNLTLDIYREWREEGRQYVRLKVLVNDLTAVDRNSPLPYFTLTQLERAEEGKYVYRFSLQKPFSKGWQDDNDVPEDRRRELNLLLEDLRMELLVKVPGTITYASGGVSDKTEVSWQFTNNDRQPAEWLRKEPELTILFESDNDKLPETAEENN